MPSSPTSSSGPGRPRSPRVHESILQATLALLAERGWDGLTMEGIAGRAGVGKAAIYRRWSGREEVLAAAVEAEVARIAIPDTGTARGDLERLMERAVALYRGDTGRMMPGLVAAMARHPPVAEAVRTGFLASRRAALREVLERGVERGELRADLDRELALDFLGGPLFYRLLVTGAPLDSALARGTVDVLLDGLAAPSPSPTT